MLQLSTRLPIWPWESRLAQIQAFCPARPKTLRRSGPPGQALKNERFLLEMIRLPAAQDKENA